MSANGRSAVISLSEQAYRVLEENLVTLRLQPGAVVSEGQLIDLTGLGRTPVREAMQRLADQELFEVMPRKGLLVAPVSLPDMLHILEARRPLERVLVGRAAVHARDEQRSGLAAVARDLALAHDSLERFLRHDRELDALLDGCAGNPFASKAVAPLRIHCRRFWYYYRHRLQLSDAISAHARLARLVARRDPQGAEKAVDGVIGVLERLVGMVERFA